MCVFSSELSLAQSRQEHGSLFTVRKGSEVRGLERSLERVGRKANREQWEQSKSFLTGQRHLRARTWRYRKFIGMVPRNGGLRYKDSGDRTQIRSKRADLGLNGR